MKGSWLCGVETLLLAASLFGIGYAGTASLPAYPLAIRDPYLSTYLHGSQAHDVTTAQPFFWAGQSLQWSILARVDGKAYNLFGSPNGVQNAMNANQTGISYTSTHTLVNLTTDGADFTLDFFSPVSPHNYTRQSMPFSYLTVSAMPHAGTTPSVQILSAIDDSWTAQQGKSKPNITESGGTAVFSFYNPDETLFMENNQMAAWGYVAFAAQNKSSGLTYGSGSHNAVNQAFISTGKLSGGSLSNYTTGELIALAQDLGQISGAASATFAVGQYRQNVISYLTNIWTGYFMSKYKTLTSVVSAFLDDYDSANTESKSFDSLVVSKGTAFSSNYSDILEATVRQIFGATEVVIDAATMNTSNPMVFLKEISSDGNIQTIDVIYPSAPGFALLAPEYLRLMLQPYLTYWETGAYTLPYANHDMGKKYPVATGYNGTNGTQQEHMPLEIDASFFILALQYQKYSNNTEWFKQYLSLVRPYADYLASNGAQPSGQLSTVDALCACANQTQLAVISAIGLNAFSRLSGMSNYSTAAQQIASHILQPGVGLSSDKTHLTYLYGNDSSWGLEFPLFSDISLGLGTFNQSVFDMQNAWYTKQEKTLGLPYTLEDGSDSTSKTMFTVTDWTMFVAATGSRAFMDYAVNTGWEVLTGGYNNVPFPTKYNVVGSNLGKYITNMNRPTVGSYFSLLYNQTAWAF